MLFERFVALANYITRFPIRYFFTVPIAETNSLHKLFYDRKSPRVAALLDRPNEKFVKPSPLAALSGLGSYALGGYGLILPNVDSYTMSFRQLRSP